MSRIRPYLDVNAASTVIYAFITTRLDYCNHLYFGLPKYKVKKLQQTGFLLRAGNRLFLPTLQVNVTGCFTEIFTEIIKGIFIRSKVKLRLWKNIAFPFQPIL